MHWLAQRFSGRICVCLHSGGSLRTRNSVDPWKEAEAGGELGSVSPLCLGGVNPLLSPPLSVG